MKPRISPSAMVSLPRSASAETPWEVPGAAVAVIAVVVVVRYA